MKVATRLLVFSLAAILMLCALGVISLVKLRSYGIDERRAQIFNMLSISRTLLGHYYDLEKNGSLTRDQAQEAAKQALIFLNDKQRSYYWVRTPAGLNLAHFNPKVIGTQSSGKAMDGSSDTDAYIKAMREGENGMGIASIRAQLPSGEMAPKLNGVYAFEPWGWWVGTGFFTQDIEQAFWREARVMAGILGAAVLVLGALAWYFSRSIVRTLGGEPAQAAAIAQRISQGYLDEPVPLRRGDQESLMHSIGQMQAQLARMVAEIRSSADAIADGAEEISSGNVDLSSRTEEQAASLEETAASMEELTRTIELNATNSAQADRTASDAAALMEQSRSVFSRMADNMNVVNSSSRKIGDITSVIDGIAFQTNILALNAAVEAARAGEQGRGFAVVASEVRALAGRSADAARQIKELILASGQQVDQGSTLVGHAGQTIRELVDSVRRVSDIMGEITASAQSQSQSVMQVSQAMGELDGMTQQNAALVEESSAAATSLKEQADRLMHAVGQFRLSRDPARDGDGAAEARLSLAPQPQPHPRFQPAMRLQPAAATRPQLSRR